ncbi:MAG: hypothetical protein HN855_12000 [Anaerolineae bacterium]|nr:hypothetical protein [Anaerolineae bacterium]MBT7070970.1 hypothetical protein [Anaerolineae bacterium]MBT7325876.1 hypothetical protein [Anaerolineae bacterium]
MREWTLGSDDPLSLTLAADARFSNPDYSNDHIWELELGSGEPAALSLRTTYGLRARAMRIFPRFREGENEVSDPASFAIPPVVTVFYANFLEVKFSPFENLEVVAEYWIPDSQSVSGRLSLINRTSTEREVKIELIASLAPLDGLNFKPQQIQAVNILAGETGGLSPVFFLTGGPIHGTGAQPSLDLKVNLGPGAKRRFNWAQAALPEKEDSFDLARRTVSRPWDAERARIELTNASQSVEIETGDPAWDAALALSQQAAFRLLFNGNENLAERTFVTARQPDHGNSLAGDGSDHPPDWGGQSPLEAYYLASLLPGAPELGEGLLKNFIATQSETGEIDHKIGLGGQRSRLLAAPFLASLAWKLYEQSQNKVFLTEIYPALQQFFWAWFSPEHDRNNDTLPEWQHPLQISFEDHPLFNNWHRWARGVDIAAVHSPSLFAALYHEAEALSKISGLIGKNNNQPVFTAQAEKLQKGAEACWDARRANYRYLDRDSNLAPRGKILHRQTGGGIIKFKESFEKPIRLLIEIKTKDHSTRRAEVEISEFVTKAGEDEILAPLDFRSTDAGSAATSKKVYTKVGKITVSAVDDEDKIIIRTVDLSGDDHTQLLPLWAGMMGELEAKSLVHRTITNAEKFDRPFGLPACPVPPTKESEAVCLSVHLPWNQLIAEGLHRQGYTNEATRLFAHLMNGILQNLRQNNAFYQSYNAEVGTGIGARNALSGLAPTGLFLELLGVRILSATSVRLDGQNPFPWAVTIRYRGLEVKREARKTSVTFANGEQVEVTDETPCTISLPE